MDRKKYGKCLDITNVLRYRMIFIYSACRTSDSQASGETLFYFTKRSILGPAILVKRFSSKKRMRCSAQNASFIALWIEKHKSYLSRGAVA